jgi:mono/diheme cytochrome c family protein
MKKINNFFFIGGVALMLLVSASCTKEGPQGIAGTNGTNGTDGTDGTTTCIECHSNNQMLYAMENQYSASMHATGPNFERNSGDCATCHTSQGFLGKLDGSYDWEAEDASISNPVPPNCYTCHEIHSTYTAADLQLTVTEAQVINNSGGQSHDFGKGNLCAACHQGRTLTPFPVENGEDIAVTSPYWGVHHGTQANTSAGLGLFEVGSGLVNSAHTTMVTDACVTCHMSDAYGTQAGGHTMWMGYEYHGSTVINTPSCNTAGCHEGEEIEQITTEFQAEISGLLAELKVKLDASGITVEGSDSPVPGTYSANVAGACINYKAISEDKSKGVHNPKYIKKLLENTIAVMN